MHSNVFIPDEFLQHISNQLPRHLKLNELIEACRQPLRRSIRVNTLKISVQNFIQKAAEKNWKLTPIPWCETGFWIDDLDEDINLLGNSAEHLSGLFYIQEASSMMPVTALFSQIQEKNQLVLDMAAAPGSKTTQIAALLENQGLVVANEFSASRVKILHANQVRCGINNCALTHYNANVFGAWLPETFDMVLLDAPCSGEGTIRKDAKAFVNWNLEAISNIAKVQKELIISAFQALKVGGSLVYSTCTLSREENQLVCEYLKSTFPDAVKFESLADLFEGADKALTEEGFLHVFPQIYDSEGFFVAKIKKIASVPVQLADKKPRKFPFQPLTKKENALVEEELFQRLGIKLPEHLSLWQREQDIWLFPVEIEALLSEIKFERIGLKLAQEHKHGYKWQHEGILSLSILQKANRVDLNAEQAQLWFKGQDIRFEKSQSKGEMLVFYKDACIGLGKWVGNKIKNGLPRDLVRDGHLFDS